MNRRDFLRTLALAGAASASAPVAWAGDGRVRWRMMLAWTRDMELFTEGAFRFAKQVSLLTESRLAIDVTVARKGVTPAQVVDMVRRGEAHCAHAFPEALRDTEPALSFYDAMPGGLTARGLDAWAYRLGGMELLKETVAPHGMYAWPMGGVGPQVLLWSRRPLDGPDALSGLRVAADGPRAAALAAVGAVPVEGLSDGAAMAEALSQGRIDAASWLGPHMDVAAGLPDAAPHGYGPSILAPGRRALFWANRNAYESLPAIVRKILGAMVREADHLVTADFAAADAQALARLQERGLGLKPVPADVEETIRRGAAEALRAVRNGDLLSAKVGKSYAAALEAQNAAAVL